MKSGATFSENRQHRYSLWRIWDETLPLAMIIGLNPSTANETESDPTIKSVIRLCKSNGFGGFYMMNCWTYVSSDPKKIMHNPMSDQHNNNLLIVTAGKCKAVIFAWGSFDIVKDTLRHVELMEMFPRAKCFGKNSNGSPKHPLYLKSDTKIQDFTYPNAYTI